MWSDVSVMTDSDLNIDLCPLPDLSPGREDASLGICSKDKHSTLPSYHFYYTNKYCGETLGALQHREHSTVFISSSFLISRKGVLCTLLHKRRANTAWRGTKLSSSQDAQRKVFQDGVTKSLSGSGLCPIDTIVFGPDTSRSKLMY